MTSVATEQKKSLWIKAEWWTAALITVVIALLHFQFLMTAGGFWRDEVNLLHVAHKASLGEMVRDSFPLLMPQLVKLWDLVVVGGDEWRLRWLGTLIGLAGLAALWLPPWLARKSPPLVSLLLYAFSAATILFGDELRPYGLGSLTVLLLFGATAFFLLRPNWKRAALLSLSSLVCAQTLFHNAVLIAGILAGAMLVCGWRKKFHATIQVLLAGCVAAVSLLPYWHHLSAATPEMAVLRSGFSWPRLQGALQDALGSPWSWAPWLWLLLVVAILATAFYSLSSRRVTNDDEIENNLADLKIFAGAAVLFSVLFYFAFLWWTKIPALYWYFLPLMALVAAAFDSIRPTFTQLVQRVILVFVAVCFCVSLPQAIRNVNARFTNIDLWAAALTSGSTPEDFIIVTPWFSGLTFEKYFRGNAKWNTLPPLADHSTHRYDLMREQMSQTNVLQPVLEKISATLRGGHRVWLVCPPDMAQVRPRGTPAPPDLPPAPLPDTGWVDEPYSWTWTIQTVNYLTTNAKNFGQIKPVTNLRCVAEYAGLYVAEGWFQDASEKSAAGRP